MSPQSKIKLSALATLVLGSTILAQRGMENVKIETIPVADNIYMLMGRGGNLGLCVGEDGAFLIDDQYAPLSEKIKAAVAEVSEQPVKFLVNTHWHGDHTGGNENFGKTGSIIIAHENVRKRLNEAQLQAALEQTPSDTAKNALPVVTFADAVTLHWNGEEIRVFHVEHAHTDGDAIIHFVKANTFHMGDTYFNGAFPYIDLDSGGSFDGLIASTKMALKIIKDDSKIIPGHGKLSNRAEMLEFLSMMEIMHERIVELIKMGSSVEEIVAAKPSEDFDAKWGNGFMTPDRWVGIIARSLQRTAEAAAKKR